MGKRKVTILEPASTAVAEVAWFIESKGLPQTAKKFVIDVFAFFETLSDDRIVHRPCTYAKWNELGYKCFPYKKKYTIVFSQSETELVISEFISSKLIHW